MDEDIIIPKKSSKVPVVAGESSAKPEKVEASEKSSPSPDSSFKPNVAQKSNVGLIIGIIAGVLLLAGGVAFFVMNNKPKETAEEKTPEEEGTSAEVEVTYVTPEDSTDPVGDFMNHLEEEKNKASTDEEKFEADLSKITFNIAIENYADALAGLEAFDTSTFSEEDWYRYYNTYVNYYKSRGLDEENALLDEYSMKATEAFNRYVNESSESEESEIENEEESEDAE